MKHICTIRRLAGLVAGLAGTAVAFSGAAPAALAINEPPPGTSDVTPPPAPVTAIAGGMPGWQITLIALGAALLAATLAVLLERTYRLRARPADQPSRERARPADQIEGALAGADPGQVSDLHGSSSE